MISEEPMTFYEEGSPDDYMGLAGYYNKANALDLIDWMYEASKIKTEQYEMLRAMLDSEDQKDYKVAVIVLEQLITKPTQEENGTNV
jgi:hypothetical protein